MLENGPVLRERLFATATFAGIALATIMALDFIVTSGFQFGSQREPAPDIHPFAYAAADDLQPAWGQRATTVPITWREPMPLEEVNAAAPPQPAGELAGGRNARVSGVQPVRESAVPSEEGLHNEIAALYAEQDARAAAREEARALANTAGGAEEYPTYVEDPPYIEEPWYEDAPAMDFEDAPRMSDDARASVSDSE